uniref:Uncharacterized protein n=1 Tax=Neobodo designis TaxID=312471 RepID=A0A7S1LXV1_NEODS
MSRAAPAPHAPVAQTDSGWDWWCGWVRGWWWWWWWSVAVAHSCGGGGVIASDVSDEGLATEVFRSEKLAVRADGGVRCENGTSSSSAPRSLPRHQQQPV